MNYTGMKAGVQRGLVGGILLGLFLLLSCTTVRSPLRTGDVSFPAGVRAYQSGRYRDAARSFTAFIENHPGDPRLAEALLKLGESLSVLKEKNRVREVLSRLIHDFPGTEEAERGRLLLAGVLFEGGDAQEALAVLRTLFRKVRSPEVKAGAYLLRGRILLKKGETGLALSQFKKSLLVSGEGKENRSFYHQMVKALDASLPDQDLKRYVDENPHGFPGDLSLYVLGMRAWKAGDLNRASRIFVDFSDAFPGHPLLEDARRFMNRGVLMQALSPVRLGCILPLSGPLKEIGNQVLQGIQLSLDRFNGMFQEEKVGLLVKDSGGDAFRAKMEMEELARDPDVLAVIGPLTSRAVVESVPVAEEHHLPLITPAATADGIGGLGDDIFRNAMTNASQGRAIARYAVEELGLHYFVVLYPDDRYGTELADVFSEEIIQLGGEILCQVSYKRGSVDFKPEIRKIIEVDMEGILSRNADMISLDDYSKEEWFRNYFPSFDAIYLPGYAEDVGLIVPQLAYYNVEPVQLLGSHRWNSMELIRRGEQYVEGAVFTDGFFVNSPHTDISEFVDRYRRFSGEDPTLFSAQAYDSSEMILQVLFNGARSREGIREGLLAIQNFPGVSGLTRVLPSGEMEKELFLIRVNEGGFQQIN